MLGLSCGSCYAFSAVEVITDRINTVGLYGAGWSTYPQEGCEACLPAGKSCSDICGENPNLGDFGWCAHPNQTEPLECCACSAVGLGNKVISPGVVIECNTKQNYWQPSSDEFAGLAQQWRDEHMGGCNGGIPVLMMDMLRKRGAGTCDEDTECTTGCLPYPVRPLTGCGAF